MNSDNKSASCSYLSFSRRSLYYQSKQEVKDWKTKQMIEGALREHPSYGHKRLTIHLRINKKRILRVMKIFGTNHARGVRSPERPRNKRVLSIQTIFCLEHLNVKETSTQRILSTSSFKGDGCMSEQFLTSSHERLWE